MKRLIYALVCLMVALCAAAGTKYAEVDGLTFWIDEDRQEAALHRVSDDIVDLVVPPTITVDDVVYKVNRFVWKDYNETGVCQDHDNLKTVNTGAVEEISAYAFMGCSSLESVVMPEVGILSEESFRDCTALVSIDAPKLFGLSGGIFRGCTALKECTFPQLCESVGGDFTECTALESVRIESPNALSVGTRRMIPP